MAWGPPVSAGPAWLGQFPQLLSLRNLLPLRKNLFTKLRVWRTPIREGPGLFLSWAVQGVFREPPREVWESCWAGSALPGAAGVLPAAARAVGQSCDRGQGSAAAQRCYCPLLVTPTSPQPQLRGWTRRKRDAGGRREIGELMGGGERQAGIVPKALGGMRM